MRVDFGGTGQGGEWLTVNLDPGLAHAAPDLLLDITDIAALRRVFAPGSIEAARCYHTLEHLPPHAHLATLAGWRDLLRPGAALDIIVPNLRAVAQLYAAGAIDGETAAGMLYVPAVWQQRGAHEHHRWGFDAETLARLLVAAGYEAVRRVACGSSHYVDEHPVPNLRMIAHAPGGSPALVDEDEG